MFSGLMSAGRTTPRSQTIWRSELTTISLPPSMMMLPLGITCVTWVVSTPLTLVVRLVLPWPCRLESPRGPQQIDRAGCAPRQAQKVCDAVVAAEVRLCAVAPLVSALACSTICDRHQVAHLAALGSRDTSARKPLLT